MDWTLKEFKDANHNPVPVVNGERNLATSLAFDAVGSTQNGGVDRHARHSGQASVRRWRVAEVCRKYRVKNYMDLSSLVSRK